MPDSFMFLEIAFNSCMIAEIVFDFWTIEIVLDLCNISKMGNALEGKTYVKGSHRTIQPRIASNIDTYKSHQRVSTSSNIHSQVSFTRPVKSDMTARRTLKKIEDIMVIHE